MTTGDFVDSVRMELRRRLDEHPRNTLNKYEVMYAFELSVNHALGEQVRRTTRQIARRQSAKGE